MSAELTEVGYARLAAERAAAEGRRLTEEHVPDATGCCVRCGRPARCDPAQLGLSLTAQAARGIQPVGGVEQATAELGRPAPRSPRRLS